MKSKKSNQKMLKISLLMFVLLFFTAIISAANSTVKRWGVFSVELQGPSLGNPFTDVQLSAVFKNGKKELKVPGFYDGNGKYIIHLSPDKEGTWTYKTESNVAELAGKTGKIKCVKPDKENHGAVEVDKTFYLKYADGTPHFSVGTTAYQWVSQSKELQDLTMKTLASAPFNKIRMCIFPKWYTYNRTEPAMAAYENVTDTTYDFTKFNPVFWRNLEMRIVELGKLGIEADIILFHPYDKWGFATMTKSQDDSYIRYAIARLSAYHNVWWAVANEYDFMIVPVTGNHVGNKDKEDWDRFLSILQNEDPYQRLRSIHNGHDVWYDHTKPYITHASVQSSFLEKGIGLRNKYQKPIIFDECKYEGNIERAFGSLSGQKMVERFWWGAMNGCYVGHGECIKAPDDILWWGKGGELHGESPVRIAYFRKIMESLPFAEMTPVQLNKDVYELSKEGEVYLVYALKASPIKITLAGNKEYTVESIDTWNMKSEVLKTVQPGEFTYDAPSDDFLLKITAVK
ncbi:MAG: DUF5060 domain-containing protein [Paludibacter sp.]|nr:DUF5060 domain-containing protein [Paludibacter sp.]